MIKGIKSISILLAVAAFTAIIPAETTFAISMPTTFADINKRLEIKEGTIYKAKSLSWNRFAFEGEINGEEDAVWYIDENGKYTKMVDANLGDTIQGILEDKYLEMGESGDTYLLDLVTGKKVEGLTTSDATDNLETTLRKAIKKDNDGLFDKSSYTSGNIIHMDKTLNSVTGGWNQFTYPLEKENLIGVKTGELYSKYDGTYLYGDYNLGDIYVSTTHGAVTIDNTGDTYEIRDNGKTYDLKAVLVPTFAREDDISSKLRITSNLSIWIREEGGSTDGDYEGYTNITNQVELGSKSRHYKLSNENDENYGAYVKVDLEIPMNGDTGIIHGIKYPKGVKTHFMCDDKGNLYDGSELLSFIVDNYSVDVDWSTYTLKAMQAVRYKTESGFNYLDIDDIREVGNYDFWTFGWGRPRYVKDGYVYGLNTDTNKYEKIFKISSSMTNIDTSTPWEVFVWNEDEGIYSFSGIKFSDLMKLAAPVSTTDTTASSTSTADAAASIQANTGWILDLNKNWNYILNDGTKAKGWLNDSGIWYYLKDDGVMAKGWLNDKGTWYYLNESGAMKANTTVDGYLLGSDGAWIQ